MQPPCRPHEPRGWRTPGAGVVIHATWCTATRIYQVSELDDPGAVYRECMRMIGQLAKWGLVHCDFNEFNLLVRTTTYRMRWIKKSDPNHNRSTRTATLHALTFRRWSPQAIQTLKSSLRGMWVVSIGSSMFATIATYARTYCMRMGMHD